MAKRAKHFTIAALQTVLDAAVARRYGGVAWAAWSGLIWSRLLMFLLATLWAMSLANIWTHAGHALGRAFDGERERFAASAASIPTEAQGESDV